MVKKEVRVGLLQIMYHRPVLVVIIPLFVPISQLNILIPEQPYFKPLWVFFIYYHSHFPHSLTTVLILS
jgi:hypothetical protein